MPAINLDFIKTSGSQIVPSGTILGTYATALNPFNNCWDGANIWVTNNFDEELFNNTVQKFTPTGQLLFTVVTGFNPTVILFDGTHIWVSHGAGGDLLGPTGSVVKLALDGTILGTYTYHNNPMGMCFDGTYIWLSQWMTQTVLKMDLNGVQQGATIPVGMGPIQLFYDGTSIWCANNGADVSHPGNTLTKIRPSDGTVLGTFTVGNFPYGMCSDGDGNLYIAIGAVLGFGFTQPSYGAVVKMTPAGTILGTFPLSGNPYFLAYDGTYIWVTHYTSQQVSVLDKNGYVLGTYPVGIYPVGVCFDGDRNAYVCNQFSNSMTKLAAYQTDSDDLLDTFESSMTSYLQTCPNFCISPPVIGTAKVGVATTSTHGIWLKDTGTYSYLWNVTVVVSDRPGLFYYKSIPAATTNTYTPVSADVGHYVCCRVTSGNAIAYSNISLVSA